MIRAKGTAAGRSRSRLHIFLHGENRGGAETACYAAYPGCGCPTVSLFFAAVATMRSNLFTVETGQRRKGLSSCSGRAPS